MISFGRINIPVKMYLATRDRGLSFDYLNKRDMNPVRYVRVDRATGEEVPYRDIVRGYEYRKGAYVVVQDEDFRRANVRKTRTIELMHFVRQADIDIKLVERPFYLEPAREAGTGYALLREALARSGKVGVARFVLRNREHLGILKAEGDVIVLDQMRFNSEMRPTAGLELPGRADVPEEELTLAVQLIERLSKPFRPEEFRDTYTEELKWTIERKAQGTLRQARAAASPPTQVEDILARLQESLAEYAHRK
jgi:DNA end-binding protein Ku